MKRTPLQRKTPLRAKKGLGGSSPLKRTQMMKRKGRKPPTAEQKRYHKRLRELGCIISGRKPVQIHHVRDGLGTGSPVNHDRVLPIHYDYHKSEAAGAISFHGSPAAFLEKYGTELDLEQKLKDILRNET